jgi:hypothetical protein
VLCMDEKSSIQALDRDRRLNPQKVARGRVALETIKQD